MMGTDELREEGNNGIFEVMTETPKKNLPIFYLLDTSGSMYGEPIAILNRAMTETMEELKKVAKKIVMQIYKLL